MKRIYTGIAIVALLIGLSAIGLVGVAAGKQGALAFNQMGFLGLNTDPQAMTPVVFISATSARAGDNVSISGMGFPANTPVQILMGRPNGHFFIVADGQTDQDGKINTGFSLPFIFVDGSAGVTQTMVVQVRTNSSEPVIAVSQPFIFNEESQEGQIQTGSSPSVEVMPANSTQPDQIRVRIAGFPASTQIRIRVLDRTGKIVFQTHSRTNSNGRLVTAFTIEENESSEANENNHTLRVEVATLEGSTVNATSDDFFFENEEESQENQAASTSTAAAPTTTPSSVATSAPVTATATTAAPMTATVTAAAPVTATATAAAPITATATTTSLVVSLPSTGAVKVALTRLATQTSGQFLVTAAGLPANISVNIYLGTLPGPLAKVGTFNTDGNGTINTQVTVPATAQASQSTENQEDWVAVLATTSNPTQLFVSNAFNMFGH